ncbi:hypothetical protein F2Q70_00020350 [Brassica cretica]|uniref:Uncharacterized protein n=1 Tax=Brassica cretica TaxID=69181 RepID=A0A8S9HLH7_BRACR|nr:hypothetical protein F2Q70_00020350 [Brassica cretica]KAF2558763.1 hypothetical protein F2Q68_00013912 [Brassica cretica]
MTPSRLFFNEKFPALVPNKILASSVSNGTSVWVNKFNIVIEELKDRNERCIVNSRSYWAVFMKGENGFHMVIGIG